MFDPVTVADIGISIVSLGLVGRGTKLFCSRIFNNRALKEAAAPIGEEAGLGKDDPGLDSPEEYDEDIETPCAEDGKDDGRNSEAFVGVVLGLSLLRSALRRSRAGNSSSNTEGATNSRFGENDNFVGGVS